MNETTPPVAPDKLWPKRIQLLLIIGITLLTVGLSSAMFFTGIGIPDETKNKGILLTDPIQVDDLVLRDQNGAPWLLAEQERKFRFVMVVDGPCDATCRDLLYTSRQVHIRLAERAPHLDRLYIHTGAPMGEEFRAGLESDYPELTVAHGEADAWRERLAQGDNPVPLTLQGHQLLLLDRNHFLMMAYTSEHAGGEMLDDVKFLLKTAL